MNRHMLSKKFLALVTSLMLVFQVVMPSNLLLAAETETTIQIIATSDTHGSFYP